MTRRTRRWLLISIPSVIFLTILFLSGELAIPVAGATARDWNPRSFWYEPWGPSGVHKGIDIFAPKGRAVTAAGSGVVVFTGQWSAGGNVAIVLGAKWRFQYYAHLDSIAVHKAQWVSRGDAIGRVGNSGNAAGKPSHLHFTVVTAIPYPWLYSSARQGWKRIYFLDPGPLLTLH